MLPLTRPNSRDFAGQQSNSYAEAAAEAEEAAEAETRMAAVFRRVRRRLERLSRHNHAGRLAQAAAAASQLAAAASSGGCTRLEAAAGVAGARAAAGEHVPADGIRELERQLAVCEALWRSSKWVV
jgi:hypothetical protein